MCNVSSKKNEKSFIFTTASTTASKTQNFWTPPWKFTHKVSWNLKMYIASSFESRKIAIFANFKFILGIQIFIWSSLTCA